MFDPGAELNTFMEGQTDKGAAVSFTGHVRVDEGVTVLELEHYPGYTESEIRKIEAKALSRWPDIDSHIIHRFGQMKPGEPIVFVAVCSAHRKDAFDAASFLMDYLKTGAPFWKKEISQDVEGEKETWIEPKASDYAAKQGWS